MTKAVKTGNFDFFQNSEISKTKQSNVKGGEDYIGHQDTIDA